MEESFGPVSLAPYTNIEAWGAERNALRYINFLYGIELLRNCNVNNLSMHIAWQYGQQYNSTWKDNNHLVYNFLCTQQNALRAFVIQRLCNLTKKLLAETKNFRSEVYLRVPITPQLMDTLSAGLQEVQTDNNLMRSFISEATVNNSLRSDSQPNPIRHYRGAFTGIEIMDRSMQGYFDQYPTSNPDLRHKHEYGPHRLEILDNKVYTCVCWLKEQMLKALTLTSGSTGTYDRHSFGSVFMVYNEFFHLYASILSVLFRMVIPHGMHPNRLDRMYQKYFAEHCAYPKYLSRVRDWSILTVEDVADCCLPMINHDYLNDTVLADLDPKRMVKFSYNATYPDSLIEKYLMTQFFVEKEL